MKPYILISLCVITFHIRSFSQSHIKFDYDSAGNRITRIIKIPEAKTVSDSSNFTLTDNDTRLNEMELQYKYEEFNTTKVKVFPNPVDQELLIRFESFDQSDEIYYNLYSSSGILMEKRIVDSDFISISFHKYPSGVYIIKLVNKIKSLDYKIIKK